jgi:hypothetical protein
MLFNLDNLSKPRRDDMIDHLSKPRRAAMRQVFQAVLEYRLSGQVVSKYICDNIEYLRCCGNITDQACHDSLTFISRAIWPKNSIDSWLIEQGYGPASQEVSYRAWENMTCDYRNRWLEYLASYEYRAK